MLQKAITAPSTRNWDKFREDLLTVANEGDHDWIDDRDIQAVLREASRSGMSPGLLISCRAAAGGARSVPGSNAQPEKTRILVIDDEARNCELLKTCLERSGFTVQTELCSENFRAAIEAFRPDLLLLDMVMPGMDGQAVLDALAADQETCSLRVIVLTGLLADSPAASVNRDGLLFLAKPMGPKSLVHCINQHLAFS